MKKYFLILTLLCSLAYGQNNLGINNSNPDPSALVDMTSTDKGLLIPRMTEAQRNAIALPANGLLVYQTTAPWGFYYHSGGTWIPLRNTKALADADNDTWVDVEFTPDDDIIRFNTGAGGYFRFVGNRLEMTNGLIAIGQNAGLNTNTIVDNTIIGSHAGKLINNTAGNTIMGAYAYENGTGQRNTALGQFALRAGGSYSVAVGYYALEKNTGLDNVAVGYLALRDNTIGTNNTAVGKGALEDNISGLYNTALGRDAGYMMSSGNSNVFLGAFAGADLNGQSKSNTTAVGAYAGYGNRDGNNTFLGYGSGNGSGGSGNVFVGYEAGKNFSGNNVLFIDNSSTATPLIYGNFAGNRVGINRIAASNTLEISGAASKAVPGDWLGNSDQRLKKNIQDLDGKSMLDKVLQLQGVTYEWNDDQTGYERPEGTQFGFVAQEIQEVFPDFVSTDADGWLQTAYGTYDPIFVEAIKEQQKMIEDQKQEIEALRAEVEELKEMYRNLNK